LTFLAVPEVVAANTEPAARLAPKSVVFPRNERRFMVGCMVMAGMMLDGLQQGLPLRPGKWRKNTANTPVQRPPFRESPNNSRSAKFPGV
jgi:hypothetical protein